MLLQTVRPNIVQSIRAYRVEDLMQAAEGAGQHFLYASLSNAQSKQDVLESIADAFLFPAHFGKNLDALYDCMTDLVNKSGQQPGFVVVLEQLPDNPRFDREAREQLLDVFRDAADFWGNERYPSGASILFSSPLQGNRVMGAGYGYGPSVTEKPVAKNASKAAASANFGMNMPLMSSAFDTAMWLTAA